MMFIAKPTKKGTGVALYGRENDLISLHEVIHHLGKSADIDSQCPEGTYLVMMNFAYEIRKAHSGQRLYGLPDDQELSGLFGAQFVWTDILIFTNTLRNASARCVNSKSLLAILNDLESAVCGALEAYDAVGAADLVRYVGKRIPTDDTVIFQLYQSIHIKFISVAGGKSRFRKISSLLDDYFVLNSTERKSILKLLNKSALENNCEPEELDFKYFPEIIW
jgi:hypothetical protein